MNLTRKEREYAENCHALVYKYLNERRLPVEEYYDVVIFGYLRAVRRYHREPELQKFAFSTIAWRAMDSERGGHQKKKRALKRQAVVLSMDAARTEDGRTLENIIMQPGEDDRFHYAECMKEITEKMTPGQKRQFELISQGHTVREIERVLHGTKRQTREDRQYIKQVVLETVQSG